MYFDAVVVGTCRQAAPGVMACGLHSDGVLIVGTLALWGHFGEQLIIWEQLELSVGEFKIGRCAVSKYTQNISKFDYIHFCVNKRGML